MRDWFVFVERQPKDINLEVLVLNFKANYTLSKFLRRANVWRQALILGAK